MKRIKKVDNDQFYTKQDVSISLIQKINLDKYKLVIDPCCGDGAFYSNINHNNKIAIDIDPKIKYAIKQDFLKWNYYGDINRKDILCISNPPFGKQGSLAIKFINKCAEFSDTIAFILPLSFKKKSMIKKINKNFHLVFEQDLYKNSFVVNGEDYDVPCVFQVWENKYTHRIEKKDDDPMGFQYVKDPTKANLSVRRVGFYAGKAFFELNKSKESHYFLKIDEDVDLIKLVDYLNSIEFKQNTTGPKSIAKGELNKLINTFISLNVSSCF